MPVWVSEGLELGDVDFHAQLAMPARFIGRFLSFSSQSARNEA